MSKAAAPPPPPLKRTAGRSSTSNGDVLVYLMARNQNCVKRLYLFLNAATDQIDGQQLAWTDWTARTADGIYSQEQNFGPRHTSLRRDNHGRLVAVGPNKAYYIPLFDVKGFALGTCLSSAVLPPSFGCSDAPPPEVLAPPADSIVGEILTTGRREGKSIWESEVMDGTARDWRLSAFGEAVREAAQKK